MIAKPAITAAGVPAAWIALVREVVQRDGHAVKAGDVACTIDVQSISDGIFRPLQLPGDGIAFTSAAERDAVLNQIQSVR